MKILQATFLILFLLECAYSLQYVKRQYYVDDGCFDDQYLITYEIAECHPSLTSNNYVSYECDQDIVTKTTCQDSLCSVGCGTSTVGSVSQCLNVNSSLSEVLTCVSKAPEVLPGGSSGQYYYTNTFDCDPKQTPMFVSEFINNMCIPVANGSVYYDCGNIEQQFISVFTCFSNDCTQCDQATQEIGCHTETTTLTTIAYSTVCGEASSVRVSSWIGLIAIILYVM